MSCLKLDICLTQTTIEITHKDDIVN